MHAARRRTVQVEVESQNSAQLSVGSGPESDLLWPLRRILCLALPSHTLCKVGESTRWIKATTDRLKGYLPA